MTDVNQTAPTQADVIQKSVTVPLPPRDAFDLFTRRMGDWWPGLADKTLQVGDHPGAPIEEVAKDGTRFEWGRILRHEAGKRLVVDWRYGLAEDQHSTLNVTFTPCDQGTRVELEQDIMAFQPANVVAIGTFQSDWNRHLQRYLLTQPLPSKKAA